MWNRLFRKYVVPFVAVVSWALLTNGLLEIYFTYKEAREQLAQIQREKANAAALRIEHFVREIERQMGWTTQPQVVPVPAALEQRQIDYVRLQRQVPAITEVAFLDGRGREQLRVSRLAMDEVAGGADVSSEPRFRETRGGRVWYGPVYFRKDSEPYMTLAVPHGSSATSPVTAAVRRGARRPDPRLAPALHLGRGPGGGRAARRADAPRLRAAGDGLQRASRAGDGVTPTRPATGSFSAGARTSSPKISPSTFTSTPSSTPASTPASPSSESCTPRWLGVSPAGAPWGR